MTPVIIDTNVIVIANHQNAKVVESCVDTCIRFIINVKINGVVLLDTSDEIRSEYNNALKMGRPHQLGALFLMHIFQQQYNSKYVRQIDIEKTPSGEFVDFPIDPALAKFDRSDRKFAALAKKSGVAVANATDSDWVDFQTPLSDNGITINFLCGCDKKAWFATEN